MSSIDTDLADVHAALDVIESAAKLPARSRATEVAPFVEDLTEYSSKNGLPSTELKRVIDVLVVRNNLDQTSRTTLLRNLYPANRLPSPVILAIVGALGHGSAKPTAATQSLLVWWIGAVHETLEEPGFLLRLYGVLFNLLDLISIRVPVCRLLELLTRRKHVRPFRIQRLLTLCQQFASEKALVNLLAVYKNFCPEIIISQNFSGRPAQSPFDSEWRTRLLALQEASSQMTMNVSVARSSFKVHQNGTKTKSRSIPKVQTFYADETSVTLEEISTVTAFVEKLERIEPPSQLIAGLNDGLLQKFLALKTSADVSLRFDFWLERYFEEVIEMLNDGFITTSLHEVLSSLLSYTVSAKRFFMTYLPIWDGATNIGIMFDLLAYLPPSNFQGSDCWTVHATSLTESDIYSTILSPLEQACFAGAYAPFDQLLDFYSKLVSRWIEVTSLGSIDSRSERNAAQESLEAIQGHVSTLILSALSTSESHGSSVAAYLDRISFATTSALSRNPNSALAIIVPQQHAFYLLLMASSLATVSRLCTILTRYYTSISVSRRSYTPLITSTINTYLMDTCNLLYRARAFVASDNNAAGCLCPKESFDQLQLYLPTADREYSLATMFSFSWHPLLSSIAHMAFKELETASVGGEDIEVWHQGPVRQRSLVLLANEGGANISWKEYRVKVMKWLAARGLGGIEQFLFATIRDLSNSSS